MTDNANLFAEKIIDSLKLKELITENSLNNIKFLHDRLLKITT